MKIFQKALMNNNLLIASDGSSDETSAAAAVVCYDKFTKKDIHYRRQMSRNP